MDAKKMNKMLVRLKYKAFTLREKGQLPSLLVSQIIKLGNDTPLEVYKYFMRLTEDTMRLNGYYKKYKEVEKVTDEEIKKLLIEKNYYLN